jgi:tetratricopeptide (TPR) repeat protein
MRLMKARAGFRFEARNASAHKSRNWQAPGIWIWYAYHMRLGGGRLACFALALLAAGLGARVATVRAADAPARSVQERCASAKALAENSATVRAKAIYTEIIESQPDAACAISGLQSADKLIKRDAATENTEAAEKLCTRAESYRGAHRDDDAVGSFKAALEKEPASESCGAAGLRSMEASTLSRSLDSVKEALPSALVFLGLLVLAGVLVLLLGYIPWVKRRPGFRYFLRGRLSLADCDDSALDEKTKVGKAFTAGIRSTLQRFRSEALDEERVGYLLDFGTGREELADVVSSDSQLSSALEKLGEASDHTKLVAAAIGFVTAVLPISRLAFSGVLGPSSLGGQAGQAHGAMARLFLERSSKLTAAVALGGRVQTTPEGGDYMALSNAAAVWVQYEVARELSGSDVEFRNGQAESYALVREGLDLHYAGQDHEAEEAFERALQIDRKNWAAHVNLAITKVRHAGSYRQAIQTLERALDEMRR